MRSRQVRWRDKGSVHVAIQFKVPLSVELRTVVAKCLLEYLLFVRCQVDRPIDALRAWLNRVTSVPPNERGKAKGELLRRVRRCSRLLELIDGEFSTACNSAMEQGANQVAFVFGGSLASAREVYTVVFDSTFGDSNLRPSQVATVKQRAVLSAVQNLHAPKPCLRTRTMVLFGCPEQSLTVPNCHYKPGFSMDLLSIRGTADLVPFHIFNVSGQRLGDEENRTPDKWFLWSARVCT